MRLGKRVRSSGFSLGFSFISTSGSGNSIKDTLMYQQFQQFPNFLIRKAAICRKAAVQYSTNTHLFVTVYSACCYECTPPACMCMCIHSCAYLQGCGWEARSFIGTSLPCSISSFPGRSYPRHGMCMSTPNGELQVIRSFSFSFKDDNSGTSNAPNLVPIPPSYITDVRYKEDTW